MGLRFAKYHGLRNDFVLIDGRGLEQPITPPAAVAICDRHGGVGADGVLLAETPASAEADVRMTIYNADGSRPQMCGNGLRTFVLWQHHRGELGLEDTLVVETDAGPRRTRVTRDRLVETEMGAISFDPARLPMRAIGSGDQSLTLGGEQVLVRPVSVGNPHAVVLGNDVGSTLLRARSIGRELSTHAAFPEGVNAGFVAAMAENELELTVWERGCGITQACGTGAVAAAAAYLGLSEKGETTSPTVRVHLPGGILDVWFDPDGVAHHRGPAQRVFDGELAYPVIPRSTRVS